MTIKEFIEKAVEGGYNNTQKAQFLVHSNWFDEKVGEIQTIPSVWLDPKAWEAVEKTGEWRDCWECVDPCECSRAEQRFMDCMQSVWNGMSLEEYIESI